MVNVARPCDKLRTSVEYPNMRDRGASAIMTTRWPRNSVFTIMARREFKSAEIFPTKSLGVTTSSFMIGSSNTVPTF